MSARRWGPPLVWAAVILFLTSIPAPTLAPLPLFRGADKLVHCALYAVLGFLVLGALRRTPAFWSRGLWAVALVSAFGAFDEWHQQFVEGRSQDALDWAADSVGGGLGSFAAIWRRPRRTQST